MSETWKEYTERMTEKYGPRDLGAGLCVCNRFAGRHFAGCPYYRPEQDEEDEDEAPGA